MSPRLTAAVIDLGRVRGMGSIRRAASWRALLTALGVDVIDVALRAEHPVRLRDLPYLDLASLARREIVPESFAWSRRSLARRLDRLDPDIVICLTARCFHPSTARPGRRVVLDLVDRLSINYRDRARISSSLLRNGLFRSLAWTAEGFEDHHTVDSVTVVAAGWADARDMGAVWVPNMAEIPTQLPAVAPDTDLLFLGNLAYPPNAEAVERIARFWPRISRLRPGTSLMLAGANPSKRTLELTEEHGWELVANFPDLSTVLPRVRLALAPIRHASGIQSKVLDAAAYAVPQVVDPVVLAGMAPGFPAAVAEDDDQFAVLAVELLDDADKRTRLAAASREHLLENYSERHWTPRVRSLLGLDGG